TSSVHPHHHLSSFTPLTTPPLRSPLFPYTTLFRSYSPKWKMLAASTASALPSSTPCARCSRLPAPPEAITGTLTASDTARVSVRSEEHTSELQSPYELVCRLLLEKKNPKRRPTAL